MVPSPDWALLENLLVAFITVSGPGRGPPFAECSGSRRLKIWSACTFYREFTLAKPHSSQNFIGKPFRLIPNHPRSRRSLGDSSLDQHGPPHNFYSAHPSRHCPDDCHWSRQSSGLNTIDPGNFEIKISFPSSFSKLGFPFVETVKPLVDRCRNPRIRTWSAWERIRNPLMIDLVLACTGSAPRNQARS
jgi:hypothetical protein